MSVDKLWNKICDRARRDKLREKLTQITIRPPRNPHEVTETQTRDPVVEDERQTAYAKEQHIIFKLLIFNTRNIQIKHAFCDFHSH